MGTSYLAKNQDDDIKSLWNYVTKIKRARGSGHEIKCNLCGLNFTGCYTRVRAHLLKVRRKGVRVCENVTPSRLIEFKNIDNEATALRVQKSKAKSISSRPFLMKTKRKTLVLIQEKRKRSRETLDYEIAKDEVHPTIVQNDPPIIERCEGDDIKLESVSTSELQSVDFSSSITGSDSDDPFDQVDKKFSVCGKETMSSGACSGDASLKSIRDAIGALELLMIRDLSEVSSDPVMQSQLSHFLDLLTTSSHPKVTVELGTLFVFKRMAFASFQEFQATVESVNKLKNFEKQKARIQKETSAGKSKWKDIKHSIKKACLAIKAGNSRKKELEAEIATLREQIAIKEMDFEQLVLNVKYLEEELSTNVMNCNSLDEKAQALCKDADDLLAASSGVEDEGKVAEVKQNILNSTWSTDLRSQLRKIKNTILGLSD
ncbi:hypothetical protein GLYMA_15G223000v4 [Glycine max]|uniref:BED-type domain-containing protein n=1 Tax=Glycine max TaxID=3847 RepID=K7MD43_SOYBN|nr:uncharacterized protein LOC102666487 isoform X1 [Glycine max]XP_040865663.1 uncharacterized protein LOC102666487 isoform X1 [Glycine max]XP_040865664.1 uncharacterized protein LOC102666487 isoform X1 [Glycine max]XP_040865665.1 uncharacterized protein LOC102666487 isoform X1 [Glycine max]XP_040865666.1 uncharacterized protein LOC102666487 isoform X1 [Glycine max]XP_040865667.1 uncharacterized protein LOC102666487 isoform X1 [Glycine max]XP_040865669.1 uncharacterized protein LOC102666487 i|eukprot:XP_006598047.1 uncharacterized protein LOC102666487 [Glycine max]